MIKELKEYDRKFPILDIVKKKVIDEILNSPISTSSNEPSSIHRAKTFSTRENQIKSFVSSLNSFYAPEKTETTTISKTKTIKYDITFNQNSKKKVLVETENPLAPYEINTLCKDEHDQMKKSKQKGDIEGIVNTYNKKVIITTEIINENKEKNEMTSDQNLALAFTQDKMHQENILLMKEIERIKEEIKRMRNQLIDSNNETQQFGILAFKYSKEIELKKEKAKKMQKETEEMIKENVNSKQNLASMIFEVKELKKRVYPNSDKSAQFIKDITRLIPSK